MAERIRRKKKYSLKLFPTDHTFIETYPGLVDEV